MQILKCTIIEWKWSNITSGKGGRKKSLTVVEFRIADLDRLPPHGIRVF